MVSGWQLKVAIKDAIAPSTPPHLQRHWSKHTTSHVEAQPEWLCMIIMLDNTWLCYHFASLFLIQILQCAPSQRIKSVYCEQFPHTATVSASCVLCLLHLPTTSRGHMEWLAHTKYSCVNSLCGRIRTESPNKSTFLGVCPHHWAMHDCNEKWLFSQTDRWRISTSEEKPAASKPVKFLALPLHTTSTLSLLPNGYCWGVLHYPHYIICGEVGRIQKSWLVRNWHPRQLIGALMGVLCSKLLLSCSVVSGTQCESLDTEKIGM